MYAFRPNNPFPAWAQGIAGLSRRHIRSFGLPNTDEFIVELTVPSVTLNTLLQPYQDRAIGLLQIDTEGYDAEILKQLLATKHRPAIINYEHKHLTSVARVDCKRRLMKAGYRFVDVYPDTLAIYTAASMAAGAALA